MDVVTLSLANAKTRNLVRSALPQGSRTVVIGDSLTYNFSGGPTRIAVQRAARAVWGGWYATQGYTLEQIQANHLPTVLALTGWQKPAACVVFGGTNNCGASSGTGFNFTTAKATHLAMCQSLVANGIMPILVAIPPRVDFALSNTNVRKWNAYIICLGAMHGWPVFDAHAAVVNASGDWTSSPQVSTGDFIHPNGYGNQLIAQAFATQLQALFPTAQPAYLSRSSPDPQNMVGSNPQLFVGTPSGGVAGGWSGSGTGCVFTVITGDTTIVGNWQTHSKPSVASASSFLTTSPAITSGFSVGDRLAFSCVYQASGFGTNTSQTGYILVTCQDNSSNTLATLTAIVSNASDCAVNAVAYDEVVVPTGTTKINVTSGIGGAATTTDGALMQLAQPTLYNLTTLGLA